jgi:hypothetical protein
VTPPDDVSLAFETEGVVTARPFESIPLGLRVSRDDAHITLWLEGDYGDASLVQATVDASGGKADVVLRAPSSPATFGLRARVEGGRSDARVDVAISASGVAMLWVVPSYAGVRATVPATTSVFFDVSCAQLTPGKVDGALQQDGALDTVSTLANVPAGRKVAVVSRLRHYAHGCTDLDVLVPGSVRDVRVRILDLPLDLLTGSFDVTFLASVASDSDAFCSLLDGATERLLDAFLPRESSEASTLLMAMRSGLTSEEARSAFDARRQRAGWDRIAATWLETHAPSLRARTASWIATGSPNSIDPLRTYLVPSQGGQAQLFLLGLGPFAADTAGFWADTPFRFVADADDVVHLTGTLRFAPKALVARFGDTAAAQAPPNTSVDTALAASIDCAGLTASLSADGPLCDGACLVDPCLSALSTMWRTASTAAKDTDGVALDVTASGLASVDDQPEPTALSGQWVGSVLDSDRAFSLRGSFAGNRH